MQAFDLFSTNKVSKKNSSVGCGSLLDAAKLVGVEVSILNRVELESVADNFLNEFTHRIEEDNRMEGLRRIIGRFLRFGDDDSL